MSYYQDVLTWHRGFRLSARDQPVTDLSVQEASARLALLQEEFDEFRHALEIDDRVEMLDALADLVFVCIGTAVAFGWNFDAAWMRVLDSNWSKLDDNGEPLTDATGKVGKSAKFRPPDLLDLV